MAISGMDFCDIKFFLDDPCRGIEGIVYGTYENF